MKAIRKAGYSALVIIGAFALTSLAFTAKADTTKSDVEFTRMDTNSDGKISPEEHALGAKQMFDAMDANKDGKVTAAEMDAAQMRVTGSRHSKGDMSSADKIKGIDIDGDGILSVEEHAAGSRAMFKKMDTNKDGFLSREELAAGHASMMKKS